MLVAVTLHLCCAQGEEACSHRAVVVDVKQPEEVVFRAAVLCSPVQPGKSVKGCMRTGRRGSLGNIGCSSF